MIYLIQQAPNNKTEISNEQIYNEVKDFKKGMREDFRRLEDKIDDNRKHVDDKVDKKTTYTMWAIAIATAFIVAYPTFFAWAVSEINQPAIPAVVHVEQSDEQITKR